MIGWIAVSVLFVHCQGRDILSTAKQGNIPVVTASYKSSADRGFTTVADFSVDDYLQFSRHYHKDVHVKNFQGNVLGYITPWNSEGYSSTILFRHKFTHLSPVWYQVRSVSGIYEVVGRHDVRQEWLNSIKAPPAQASSYVPKIVPRFVFEIAPSNLPAYPEAMDDVINMIIKEIKWGQYDGLVLEAWTQWSYIASQLPGFKTSFMQPFIQRLSSALRKVSSKSLELILVVPPSIAPTSGISFSSDNLVALQPYVDMFSVCTYDYSTPFSPGPNAPLDWVNSNMKQLSYAAKTPASFLMGLNFYGIDHNLENNQLSQHVTYKDFLNMFKDNVVVNSWDSKVNEHTFQYVDSEKSHRHIMYYPTAKSLSDRIQVAKQLGVGISIWELGQGLESFFDLL